MKLSNVDYTLRLTPEQRRFFDLLSGQSYLQCYWSLEKRECKTTALEDAMGRFSHGERIMAQFLSAIWFGENRFKFDLFEAVEILGKDELKVISDWMIDPFWP